MAEKHESRTAEGWNWRDVQTEPRGAWLTEQPRQPSTGDRWGDPQSGLSYLWDGQTWIQMHTD